MSKVGPCTTSANGLSYSCGLQLQSLPDLLSNFSVVLKTQEIETKTEKTTQTQVLLQNKPTLISILPNEAGTQAESIARIQGSGFLQGATVKLGNVSCTVLSLSSSQIQCRTGIAQSPGQVSLSVENPKNSLTDVTIALLENAFTYLPSNSWINSSLTANPSGIKFEITLWTGSKAILYGGVNAGTGTLVNAGTIYDPVSNSFTPMSTTNAPTNTYGQNAVWSGSKLVIFGGNTYSSVLCNTGGRYDPLTNSWAPTTTLNAPSIRYTSAAVWTSNRMFVWGGENGSHLNTGALYDPENDVWTTTSTTNAPWPRTYLGNNALWTGSKVIVWGGYHYTNTGGLYDPDSNTWTEMPVTNAPSVRYGKCAVWAGSKMLVWGGVGSSPMHVGGVFDPQANSWTKMSTIGAPSERWNSSIVWTGSRMVIFGGDSYPTGTPNYNDGGIYDPTNNTWENTSTLNAPSPRKSFAYLWMDSKMLIWGGYTEPALGHLFVP